MRNEQEMLELITGTARGDERIRAVIMNGSRANPNAKRDIFQDFDIVYLVTDVAPFKHNYEWIKIFGELMIMQIPVDDIRAGSFVYLMQFADGNRIDLTLYPYARFNEFGKDSLTVVLLDKDGLPGPIAPAGESDYLPRPPALTEFKACCNEFWWVCPYVAKGLWRKEILYAKHALDCYARGALLKMITWYFGVKTQFARNPGASGKHLGQLLEPEMRDLLLKTYSAADYGDTWEALAAMCVLFRKAAVRVALHFGYDYPHNDDKRVSAHLEHVRSLPGDAEEIYP